MAKQPELDDFRVPFFDEGKKNGQIQAHDFDPGREAVFERLER